MKKKLLFFLMLCYSSISYGQLTCPELTSPMNGETNVAVDATITWNAVVGAPGYLISIGTTPGGTDILNEQSIGNTNTYQPPFGLPENEDIYVRITIFFFNAPNVVCANEMFQTEDVTEPPNCTTILFPLDEATNVNVASSISWNYTPKAIGYNLSLGTTLGGSDILDNETIVREPFYQPKMDLPVNAEIFVTIIPYNENGPAQPACLQYSFTTGALVIIPTCASLITPANGAINVPLSPILEWTEIPDATGYRVTIGTTLLNANVLDNVTFTENSTLVLEFEPNRTFFITIVPFNMAGDALGCEQQSFSTILGCGPYFDTISNQFVDLRPEINFPDRISICENELPFTIASEDIAAGFRWYKIDEFDNEELIATKREINLTEAGKYRYEAYNIAIQSANTIECDISKIFEVISSNSARINDLVVTGQNGTVDVSVRASGIGNYEYAVDAIEGPYQNDTEFQNLEPGSHTFYVRDKNGCGITEMNLTQDITVDGFPNFFTPNGDGVNDFWQFIPSDGFEGIEIKGIFIFDKFGMFLKQINHTSQGWDGNFNGQLLPASDYWFKAVFDTQKEVRGHFTLKR